jgi:hypothetical protein
VRAGNPIADTAITCTISGTNTTCQHLTYTASISAGDVMSIKKTFTGAPTARFAHFSIVFDGADPGQSLLMPGGHDTQLSGPATGNITEYLSVFTSSGPVSSEFGGEVLIPTSGTIKSLYVRLITAPGTSNTRRFMLRKNNADTSLTCDIGGTNTTCSDVANSVSITAGDSVTLQSSTFAGTPAASLVQAGLVFEADVDGEFIWGNSGPTNSSTSATQFKAASAGGGSLHVTETNRDQLAQRAIVRSIYAESSVAPGAAGSGKSYTIQFRQDAASTGPGCAISETSTTCNATSEIEIAPDDFVATQITPSATAPTVAAIRSSYLVYVPPRRVTIVE